MSDELSLAIEEEEKRSEQRTIVWAFFGMVLTSASAFHSFLSSAASCLHCSPMILEMSGLGKPGCCATVAAC